MISRRLFLSSAAAVPFLRQTARAEILLPKSGDQTGALQAAIDVASQSGGVVQLGAGTYHVNALTIRNNVTIQGVPGATTLRSAGGHMVRISGAKHVVLQGLELSIKGISGNTVAADNVKRLIVQDCAFTGGEAGVRMTACGGRITGNDFAFHKQVAVQSVDSTGLEISSNTVSDIGNNGIQVWREQKGESPTIVSDNFVSRIAAEDGGDGPNGNGINIYAAHGVIVANNRVSDCAFTAIRNASSDACIITGNNIARCNEVAMYVEFEFNGAVVANNIIDTASHGIAITNFLQGGRLAQCSGNVVRNIRGVDAHGRPLGGGIAAEADTVIANNVIDNAAVYGISMGWGKYAQNLSATGNIVKDCGHGIRFSAVGPGPYIIANNIITGAKGGAIVGMDHDNPVTEDLSAKAAKIPDVANISGNMVRS